MSDLAATNCSSSYPNTGGCSWIIILLLLCCCGNGNGFGDILDFGGNNTCDCIIPLLLLFCFCGNNGKNNGGCSGCC